MKTYNIKLIKSEQLTHDVFKYTFNVSEDFTYQPGQFVTFMIDNGEEKKPRSYSVFDYFPEKKEMAFLIKIVEGGFAGNVFAKMELGQEFEVRGPLGHFTFNPETNEEHWFIGCGCGLAPLYNMLMKNVEKFPKKKFALLFSVKRKEDLILHQELEEMEKENPNFTYLPTLTREEWEGLTGRVQKHLPADLKNKTFYICGLKELVLDTKELLVNKGVNPKEIKFERYS